MTLHKVITIDLAKKRAHIKTTAFTAAERKRLAKLVDMFERGEFTQCIAFLSTWGRTKDKYPEADHVGTEILDVLRGIKLLGDVYEVVK